MDHGPRPRPRLDQGPNRAKTKDKKDKLSSITPHPAFAVQSSIVPITHHNVILGKEVFKPFDGLLVLLLSNVLH
jgi:hypothetical protein